MFLLAQPMISQIEYHIVDALDRDMQALYKNVEFLINCYSSF
jgi:hypothetical protein